MTILLIILGILSMLGIRTSIKHKGSDDRNAKDRYQQTAELTRQMREQVKNK